MIIHPTRYAACLKSWQTTPPFANEIGRNGCPRVGNFRNSNNKLAYGRSVYANQTAGIPVLAGGNSGTEARNENKRRLGE